MEEIINNLEVSDRTKNVYLSLIKRLERDKFKFPLKTPQKENYVKEYLGQYPKFSTRLDLLNIVVVIRNAKELKTDKLKDLRKTFQKIRVEENIEALNEKRKDLLTLEQFKEELETAYNQKQWKKYIVNYLWSNYGVRNKDVDVEIVMSRKKMTDPNQNYLWRYNKGVKWIRNNYKTSRTYGKQEILITDPSFINAVKSHKEGKVLQGNQIGNALRKLMINKMSEADVFKMLIDSSYYKEDTEKINQLSKFRGTNIETILNFYDINKKKEVIREM